MRFPQVQSLARFVPSIETGCLLALALLRLYLTGDRDILPLNAGHDDFWYVNRAFVGVWSGPYDELSFVHPSIYAVWLQLLKIFGIPLRLAIDLAWIASVVYLARSVRNFSKSIAAAVLLAAFLLLHPYSLFIFDRVLAETLLLVTATACLAAGLDVWTFRGAGREKRQAIAILVFSIMFALSFHMRKEGIALAAPLLVLAMLTLLSGKTWWSRRGFARAPGVALVAWPMAAAFGLGLVLSSLNFIKWGDFARYELASPGYEKALGALSSIDTGRTPKQISVTRQMLEEGYAVSPTLAELKPQMDGAVGQKWVDLSRPFVAAEGEIGNGWFYWALRDAAARAGWHSSAPFADSKYLAVSKELQRAFKNGRLKRRRLQVSSFLDSDYGKWMPSLPASLLTMLRITLWPAPENIDTPVNPATERQLQEYARVTGLRSLPPSVSLSGWVIAPAGTFVAIKTGSQEPAWIPVSPRARPDVPGAFAMTIHSQAVSEGDRLAFRTPDGKIGEVALDALDEGHTVNTSGEFVSVLGIDELVAPGILGRRADAMLGWLSSLARIFTVIFSLALLSLLLSVLLRRRVGELATAAFVCLVFLAFRLGLFALIDASSWNGAQARYLMPVLPFFACAGALGIANSLQLLSRRSAPYATEFLSGEPEER